MKSTQNLILNYLYILSLLLPLFFFIDGNIYFEKYYELPVEKNIFNVPLPISFFSSILVLCFITFKKKFLIFNDSIIKILFLSIALTLLMLFLSNNFTINKFIQIAQFCLPWFGLIISLNLKNNKNIFKIILYFLSFFVSLQILITIISDKLILIKDVVFFTVYQNIQYVGTVFVLLTILVSINLYRKNKINVVFLNIITLIYAILTYSFISITTHVFFIFASIIYLIFNFKDKRFFNIFIFIVFIIITTIFFVKLNGYKFDQNKFIINTNQNYFENFEKFQDISKFKMPENINLRLHIWKKYFKEVKNNKIIILIGDKDQNLDKKYRSAHNLFIDIVYKLGIFFLIPYIILFIKFFNVLIYSKNNKNDFYSCFFIFIVIILENFFKVSLKQPYPGLISFYFIGYYLNKYK